MFVFLFGLAVSMKVTVAATPYNFLSIGDWGGAALEGQALVNVEAVASQMAITAAATSPSFILGTGDNFYWCGIQNTSDFQIDVDFVKPYSADSLQLPWYTILGNHEYGYNVQAQLDYAKLNSRWILDSRYYTRRVEVDSSTNTFASFVFLDSSPCVSAYRSPSNSGWDPCGKEYPTCSLIDTDDDFEAPCEFHSNILTQSCEDQFEWLKSTLASVPENDWLIIAAHHPLTEINVMPFVDLLQSHGFALYLNGHAHTMTQYTVDGKGAYLTTGAGSLVNTVDQTHRSTRAKVLGLDEEVNVDATGSRNSHKYETVWNLPVAGFTQHSFSADYTTLRTDFVSYTGEIVHSFTSNREGEIV